MVIDQGEENKTKGCKVQPVTKKPEAIKTNIPEKGENNMTTELDKFFEGLPSEDKQLADVFNDKPKEEAPVQGEEPEDDGEVRKNRRHRRLEEALQKERESNIALAARIETLSEVQKFTQETTKTGEVPHEWIALYGDTPEARRAWEMEERLISRAKEEAKNEALEEFENRQNKVVQEQKQYESLIDSELESLEDTYNVDLTSNAPSARKARREFLELVQSLSPKDEAGNIADYADFGSTFEVYQKTRQSEKSSETSNKQKELASRSMQKPGGDSNIPTQITPGFRGWMNDYNLE